MSIICTATLQKLCCTHSSHLFRIYLIISAALLVGCVPQVPLPKVFETIEPAGLSTKAVAVNDETGEVVLKEVQDFD